MRVAARTASTSARIAPANATLMRLSATGVGMSNSRCKTTAAATSTTANTATRLVQRAEKDGVSGLANLMPSTVPSARGASPQASSHPLLAVASDGPVLTPCHTPRTPPAYAGFEANLGASVAAGKPAARVTRARDPGRAFAPRASCGASSGPHAGCRTRAGQQECVMTIRNLDHLFAPSGVALVGASAEPGSVGL